MDDLAAPDPHHMRETLVLLASAIRNGWQIPDAALRSAPNIAAEQLNRKCYGMEISPAYCDVIVARWEKLTGKVVTREKN